MIERNIGEEMGEVENSTKNDSKSKLMDKNG